MITVRPGSQMHLLVTVLGIVGEYPIRSLGILGNKRAYRELTHKLTKPVVLRQPDTNQRICSKLLVLSGKGWDKKTIRFHRRPLTILSWIHPDARDYYMDSFNNHHFRGDAAHVERNHRVAEAVAMCMRSGIEVRPYMLPKLQNERIQKTVPDKPCFYLARDMKKIDMSEQNKTMFTRIVGAVFYPGGCYAVYNTRSAVMKWNGMGEFKAKLSLTDLARQNAMVKEVYSAILFGADESTGYKTLEAQSKLRRPEFRFDGIYRHVHFIPMDDSGIRLLKILTIPDWNEKLLELMFEPEYRSYGQGFMEYDAFIDGKYIFSHLDGDLARLMRFRDAVETRAEEFEVLCFDFQAPFLKDYLGKRVRLRIYELSQVEEALQSEGGT